MGQNRLEQEGVVLAPHVADGVDSLELLGHAEAVGEVPVRPAHAVAVEAVATVAVSGSALSAACAARLAPRLAAPPVVLCAPNARMNIQLASFTAHLVNNSDSH